MASIQQTAYLNARKLGKKYVSDNSAKSTKGYLPVLSDILQKVEIVGEINLGQHEIPLSKVIGTHTAARSNAFAGNFMPLLSDDSEFALKWQALYLSHIEEGIREPIKVYEYINRYFVLEGNKRVSVLNLVGAVSVLANVTRLLPHRDEANNLISIYYEFLDYDKRALFDTLWFSQKGNFTRLVGHAERYLEAHPDAAEDVVSLINITYKHFRPAFKRANLKNIDFTTGDALVEYCDIFGLPFDTESDKITENVRSYHSQLLLLARQQDPTTIEHLRQDFARPIFRKKQCVKAAFAFESTPDAMPWTRHHEAAMRRLIYKYGDNLTADFRYNVPEGMAAYPQLKELIDGEPDVLFTTSPGMAEASLRIALENPRVLVLNCNHAQDRMNLNTYFCKFHEVTFLSGVMAGAMSRTDRLGYMSPQLFPVKTTYNVNAFALGALLVNPKIEVFNYWLEGKDNYSEQDSASRRFVEAGADIAFCQYTVNNPLNRKAFPGIFGHVNLLDFQNAFNSECLGAASCDWSIFYDQMIGDFMNGRGNFLTEFGEGHAVHFGWGLDTGMSDIYGVDIFMGRNATTLLGIFREIVSKGMLHPFAGPVYDTGGHLRIDSDTIPTLQEIQNIDWYAEGVSELA